MFAFGAFFCTCMCIDIRACVVFEHLLLTALQYYSYNSAVPQAHHSASQSAGTEPQSRSTCRSEFDDASQQRASIYCCIAVSQAQHSAISPRKAAKQLLVPIRVRQRKQLARDQQMSSSMYTARWVLETDEEIKICPVYQIIFL